MDLIRDHKHVTNEYSKKIRIIKYTEGENITIEKEGAMDICEIIISQNDNEYSTIQKQQRQNYIINKKLEIADNVTKDEKFNKSFSPKIIQAGLQNKNCLSSILYMNELYKINTIICNRNKLYKTTHMDYPILLCEYKNNSWHYLDHIDVDVEYNPNVELPNIITQDTNLMIFKSTMMPLSKYKVKELEEMCIKKNINTMKNGKKKLKKELYEELLLHCLM